MAAYLVCRAECSHSTSTTLLKKEAFFGPCSEPDTELLEAVAAEFKTVLRNMFITFPLGHRGFLIRYIRTVKGGTAAILGPAHKPVSSRRAHSRQQAAAR